jgi:hypothetical protein
MFIEVFLKLSKLSMSLDVLLSAWMRSRQLFLKKLSKTEENVLVSYGYTAAN